MKTRALKFTLPGLLALLFAAAGPLSPDLAAQAARGGISRSMEQAIRLYHEGEDTEAMDRFMDILVKGSPSEKALANDYISKITLRMNTGVNTVKDRGAEPTTLTEVSAPRNAEEKRQTPLGARPAPLDEEEEEADRRDDAAAQRERVAEKINAKISQMRRDILLELNRSNPVKVYMGSDGMPRALTLDPAYFFASETTFKPGADRFLGLLSGLLFTLGKANVLLLPEGSAEGDVKIRSIRRALALNSYFESRGVSKARLEVNLTGTDVRFPKELTSISGIIILFDYDKAPRLKDLEDLQTRGPKVSLGIYPTAIAVHQNEGAIVEFSAFESPLGQPSWKFQIYQIQADRSRLLLQEMSGSGSQYNQSFWNGRKKFFGAPYPSGRYMFTVTAADNEGKETSLSRLLVIRPTPEEEKAAASKAAARKAAVRENVSATGLKSKSLGKGVKGGTSGKVLKASASKKGRAVPRKAAKKTPAKKKAAPAAEEEAAAPAGEPAAPAGDAAGQGELSGQVSYRIYFMENNALTAASGKRLAQVAETMGYYPMAKIRLIGYAYSGEANAEAVAETRVNKIASILSQKYSIDQSRMELSSKVSEATKPMVEIKLAGNQ
jgi:outer membrane protein OmpA-like peptidoglycan-associated protein